MADFSAWAEKNKALWARVYDEVIAPGFEEEWKKREKEHRKELKQKEENQQILFTRIGEEAVKNSHLVAEMEKLKEQLQKEDGVFPSTLGQDVVHGVPPVSVEEHRHLSDRFNELSKKYQDVCQKAKYLERKNSTVMQKNKDMKESVRAWQAYADRQAGKQRLKSETRGEDEQLKMPALHHLPDDQPHVPSSPRSVASVKTPRSFADLDRSSPGPVAPRENFGRSNSPMPNAHDEGRCPSAIITPKPTNVVEHDEQHQDLNNTGQLFPTKDQPHNSDHEMHLEMHDNLAHPTSSQTTEDETAERQAQHPQALESVDDDDVPQFVLARSLKRKRAPPLRSTFEIFADRSSEGTPARPYRVKEEQFSSPPPTTSKFMRTETFDLDDPMPNVLQTPRHRKRKLSIHSSLTGTLRQQRSSSAPFTQLIKRENTGMDASLSGLHNGLEVPLVASTEVRAISEPSTQNDIAVLQPLDPNILTSAPDEAPNKRSKRAGFPQDTGHGIFVDSGKVPHLMEEDELRLPPPRARVQQKQRLQALKNPKPPKRGVRQTPKPNDVQIKQEPIPTPPPSISRSIHTPLGGSGLRTPISNVRLTPRGELALDSRPVWTMSAPKTRSRLGKARRSSFNEEDRLRNRPVTELNLKDFKINPAYNQGYTYAFSETVRKRGDRMCLPGCTNSQCCGSTFRAFAEAQAPLPASQEEALLEDYLGDAYNNMQLTQMSMGERAELVLQARTKKMANESGKHREAFERRKTPPGFWRVDFPTTQEQQEDREKAKELERKAVQERWLEAQRKGGKWIFRDE